MKRKRLSNFSIQTKLFLVPQLPSIMLPSRLYRNVGIPPPLRSLLLPNPSLSPSLRVQLRLRLGVFSNTALNAYSTGSPSNEAKTVTSQALPEKMEPRMSITFTCTVKDCLTRSTHQFTKRSYEQGIVLVECPGCHNR